MSNSFSNFSITRRKTAENRNYRVARLRQHPVELKQAETALWHRKAHQDSANCQDPVSHRTTLARGEIFFAINYPSARRKRVSRISVSSVPGVYLEAFLVTTRPCLNSASTHKLQAAIYSECWTMISPDHCGRSTEHVKKQ